MTFLEAIKSNKKIRSVFWTDGHIDTSIFTDELDDLIKDLIYSNSEPLTWKEILNEWIIVEN
jgi:hypothetical protein